MAGGKRSRPSTSQSIERAYAENEPGHYGIHLPDSEAQRRWNELYEIPMKPTKYPDDHCLQRMGIYDDVWDLFARVGWTHIMRAKWATYKILVLEFLSTFAFDKRSNMMFFQLGNEPRQLTIEDFNVILQVPLGGLVTPPQNFDHMHLWSQLVINNERYVSNASKATSIRNPVFRYIQRVMAHHIFGRENNSGVTVKELFAFHCLITSTNLDVGHTLREHFQSLTTTKTNAIHIGGFITPIAEHFNVHHSYTAVVGSKEIGLNTLSNMRMIEGLGDIHLIFKDRQLFPLPNPTLTTVRDTSSRANWRMDSPAHLAWQRGDTQGSHGESSSGVHRRAREGMSSERPRAQSFEEAMEARMQAMEERATERHTIYAHELHTIREDQTRMMDNQARMMEMMNKFHNYMWPRHPPPP